MSKGIGSRNINSSHFRKLLSVRNIGIFLFISSLLYTVYPSILEYKINFNQLNGPIKGWYNDVPDYYFDLKNDLENRVSNNRILVLPFHYYGVDHYWKTGGNIEQLVPETLINERIITVNQLEADLMSGAFRNYLSKSNFLSPHMIRLLNIDKIVLLRDIDRRYKNPADELIPHGTKYFRYEYWEDEIATRNFIIKDKDYFLFSRDYLSTLPNDVRAPSEVQDKIYGLDGKYAISTFNIKDEYVTPPIYVVPSTDIEYLDEDHQSLLGNNNLLGGKTTLSSEQPLVEYQEISPTRYLVNIKNVRNDLVLMFMESFNKSWRLYLFKEGDLKEENKFAQFGLADYIDDQYHFVANYYSNAWELNYSYIIDHLNDQIVRNTDGSVDINLMVEYSKEGYLLMLLLISLSAMVFMVSFLIWVSASDRIKRD